MDAGELVTDEIVIGLIEEQLEAHPEGEQEIRLLNRVVGLSGAVHSHHSQT